MSSFDRAFEIAITYHSGQKDRYGQPYILHPVRMMLRFNNEAERIVALLHDVVERSGCSLKELRQEGFSREIVEAVDQLTKRKGESYPDYLSRVEENPLAVRVKLADLEDNMNMTRIHQLSDEDLERLRFFHEAWSRLKNLKD